MKPQSAQRNVLCSLWFGFDNTQIEQRRRFICPEQETEEKGNPIYGKVIFIPENGDDIQNFNAIWKG